MKLQRPPEPRTQAFSSLTSKQLAQRKLNRILTQLLHQLELVGWVTDSPREGSFKRSYFSVAPRAH